MTFYDRNGKPIAYTEDGEKIYLFTGQPVAYIHDDAVFGYNGKHMGWFEDGWIRDLRGLCVFYTENTNGGPLKPLRQLTPLKDLRQLTPFKGVRQVKCVKATKSLNWSNLSGIQFFK